MRHVNTDLLAVAFRMTNRQPNVVMLFMRAVKGVCECIESKSIFGELMVSGKVLMVVIFPFSVILDFAEVG